MGEVVGPGSRSGTSRRDPHGLGQVERLRKFSRRLGQFPLSAEILGGAPAPPVTSAPARPPHHLDVRIFSVSLVFRQV